MGNVYAKVVDNKKNLWQNIGLTWCRAWVTNRYANELINMQNAIIHQPKYV